MALHSNTPPSVENAFVIFEGTQIKSLVITNTVLAWKDIQPALLRNHIHVAGESGRRNEAFEIEGVRDTSSITNDRHWAGRVIGSGYERLFARVLSHRR